MSKRVYLLCKMTKWNVLGVYTNLLQVRQSLDALKREPTFKLKDVILQEVIVNEGPGVNCSKTVTYLL